MQNRLGSSIVKKFQSLNGSKSNRPCLQGFTLIEILMVCALLAFLMAIMVGGYGIAMSKMAESNTRATIAKIETALESYKAKTGYYIQKIDGDFNFPIADPTTTNATFYKFIDYEKMSKTSIEDLDADSVGQLIDSFGKKYWYRCPGTHNRMSFDLESAGADGQFGYVNDTATTASNNHLVIDTSNDYQADNINNWE